MNENLIDLLYVDAFFLGLYARLIPKERKNPFQWGYNVGAYNSKKSSLSQVLQVVDPSDRCEALRLVRHGYRKGWKYGGAR